ncbi:carbohydrate kinase family protein [Xanthomonas sp. GPE 39]|uniref:carbohydrate kinase family protein n=1 Tax=Xanthomonas sp. GPE 39 TaxID=1583099 RepID=UPI0005F2C92C|nr:carbohydrate kinase family protein [Xanthomonas sp. GPE 39]
MKTTDVVVVGEVYLDHIFSGFERWPGPGEEALAQHYHRELGGGTINTACGLARLGRRVGMIGAIGSGDRAWFAQRLRDFGLDTEGLIDSPLGTGVTASVSLREDRTFFTYPGANAALEPLLRSEAALAAMRAARHVHFAMPLPPSLAHTLLPQLRAAGCSTSLDVGFAPAWLADTANHVTCRAVDYFLPNQKEAALAGCTNDEASAYLAWTRALGLTQVAIKLGAAGACVIDATGTRQVAAPTVAVRDTTGAGDAFDAGFIDALLEREPLHACAQRGCLCGAACCTALGALDGLPDSHHLRSFHEQFLSQS